jgi:hypothetical protein
MKKQNLSRKKFSKRVSKNLRKLSKKVGRKVGGRRIKQKKSQKRTKGRKMKKRTRKNRQRGGSAARGPASAKKKGLTQTQLHQITEANAQFNREINRIIKDAIIPLDITLSINYSPEDDHPDPQYYVRMNDASCLEAVYEKLTLFVNTYLIDSYGVFNISMRKLTEIGIKILILDCENKCVNPKYPKHYTINELKNFLDNFELVIPIYKSPNSEDCLRIMNYLTSREANVPSDAGDNKNCVVPISLMDKCVGENGIDDLLIVIISKILSIYYKLPLINVSFDALPGQGRRGGQSPIAYPGNSFKVIGNETSLFSGINPGIYIATGDKYLFL